MNPAFQEALATRSLWIDVAALAGIEGCEAQTEAALEAVHNAEHKLASKFVLAYRHYGPRVPIQRRGRSRLWIQPVDATV